MTAPLTDYERGYLDGQRNRDSGGRLIAGTFDHTIASVYDQGYVDGHSQKQGHIDDPRVAAEVITEPHAIAMEDVREAINRVDRSFRNGWVTVDALDTLWAALDIERRLRHGAKS
jgi:hypothetical protein